jgi:hypothetical protein
MTFLVLGSEKDQTQETQKFSCGALLNFENLIQKIKTVKTSLQFTLNGIVQSMK